LIELTVIGVGGTGLTILNGGRAAAVVVLFVLFFL